MTLIGIISDAHGNPLGLAACLRRLEAEGASKVFLLGDAVGYMPMASDVLHLLQQHHVTLLMGNHEAMLCGLIPLDPALDEIYGLRRLRRTTDLSLLKRLSRLPKRLELKIGSRRILLVHGSPWQDLSGYVYQDANLSSFESLGFSSVFLGHTHRPFVRTSGETLVANVGSCGLPRDHGRMACCALYDPTANEVEIIRVPFDADDLIARCELLEPLHESVRSCLLRTDSKGVRA